MVLEHDNFNLCCCLGVSLSLSLPLSTPLLAKVNGLVSLLRGGGSDGRSIWLSFGSKATKGCSGQQTPKFYDLICPPLLSPFMTLFVSLWGGEGEGVTNFRHGILAGWLDR